MKKRIASKELSGVLILIFTVLFLQTIVFLFRPSGATKEFAASSVNKEPGTQNNPEKSLKNQTHSWTGNNRAVNNRSGIDQSSQNQSSQNKSGQDKTSGDRITNSRSSAKEQVAELFFFDPNTVLKDELIRLGMTEKQASVVLNYRYRGGKFRDKEDFRKIYSVSDQLYSTVQDYIVIKQSEDNIKHSVYNSNQSGNDFKQSGNSFKPPDNNFDQSANNYNQSETNFATAGVYQNVGREWREEEFLLELNGADSADLTKLKGIGPYFASKILRYRERLGGFVHPGQLTEIRGIDSERYMMFSGNVFVDTTMVEKRDLATATYSQLSSNPYIGSYIARAIIRYAERNEGQKISITDLLAKNIIKRELYNILRIYFR